MIFYILLLFFHFEVNCSTIFVLGTEVNITKKHMDDWLCVCFPVTSKSSKSCTHTYLLHFLLQNTYLFVK